MTFNLRHLMSLRHPVIASQCVCVYVWHDSFTSVCVYVWYGSFVCVCVYVRHASLFTCVCVYVWHDSFKYRVRDSSDVIDIMQGNNNHLPMCVIINMKSSWRMSHWNLEFVAHCVCLIWCRATTITCQCVSLLKWRVRDACLIEISSSWLIVSHNVTRFICLI